MVITLSAPEWPPNGPRPINLKQDIPQVADLLELAFGEKMDRESRQAIRSSNFGNPAFLWRLNPQYNRLPPGYVWQENGRIVGNVTLIATKIPGRHIIANVAVHPDFRRRGIARALMEAVLEQVRARHGNLVILQVVKDNNNAIDLYKSLQFEQVGTMSEWRTSSTRLRDLAASLPDSPAISVQPLRGRLWQEAYKLDAASLHPDLSWPEPVPEDFYRQGIWPSVRNFLNGRMQETWAVQDKQGQLTGLASIIADWGRPYTLVIRIHPEWRGQLERPLLAKLIRRLQHMGRRNIVVHYPDGDPTMDHLLQAANFSQRRALTHMRRSIY